MIPICVFNEGRWSTPSRFLIRRRVSGPGSDETQLRTRWYGKPVELEDNIPKVMGRGLYRVRKLRGVRIPVIHSLIHNPSVIPVTAH